jgi:hypothetical protein
VVNRSITRGALAEVGTPYWGARGQVLGTQAVGCAAGWRPLSVVL